ncbi:MAG: Fe-S cluster assembly protein SufD [Cyclobacteriaceae bacterium]|nr:Fe-S cluster assembly protein SufD [Cyclobacteriaceae bacterium]
MSTATEKQSLSTSLIASIDLAQFSFANEQRTKAFEAFKTIGLPEPKNEEYKFTPVTRSLSKHFSASELSKPTDANESVKSLLNPEFSENRVVFVNGMYSKTLSTITSDSKVTVQSLNEALASNPSLLFDQLNTTDPFALLNSTLWSDGLYINVPKNIEEQKPLFIHHLHDASSEKVSAHTKLFITVGESASLQIIEKTDTQGNQPVFNTISEDIIVGENGAVNYCKIQNDAGQLIQVANTTIHQHRASRADTYTLTLNGQLIRNNLNIIIDGEGCESHFYGLYLSDGDTLVDNHTTVDHKKPNSFSNELYKGLMDGKSKGVFNGKIYVRPHAQKTNAFQSNRNLLLSDDATVNTKPQLEIWADDVKCSHGCTTGQLDEEALFYLQSRGIPKATAKAMLLYAFAAEVMETIKNEQLKNYIDSIVSERLHKSY